MYWFIVIYFIIATVNVFPVIYLNNISNYLRRAVVLRETELLTTALENIKKYFKYLGILTIVMIAFNILSVIFTIYLLTTFTSIPELLNNYLPQ